MRAATLVATIVALAILVGPGPTDALDPEWDIQNPEQFALEDPYDGLVDLDEDEDIDLSAYSPSFDASSLMLDESEVDGGFGVNDLELNLIHEMPVPQLDLHAPTREDLGLDVEEEKEEEEMPKALDEESSVLSALSAQVDAAEKSFYEKAHADHTRRAVALEACDNDLVTSRRDLDLAEKAVADASEALQILKRSKDEAVEATRMEEQYAAKTHALRERALDKLDATLKALSNVNSLDDQALTQAVAQHLGVRDISTLEGASGGKLAGVRSKLQRQRKRLQLEMDRDARPVVSAATSTSRQQVTQYPACRAHHVF